MKKHILISRTDAIGDVVLTLPMCGYLKEINPDIKLSFLGKSYTKAVIEACTAIDNFVNFDDLERLAFEGQVDFLKGQSIDTIIHVFPNKQLAYLAKNAGIPQRIGTMSRWYHWLTCNNLVRLSRKNSGKHEAELNMLLLKGVGIKKYPALNQLYKYNSFRYNEKLSAESLNLLCKNRFNLVLHPKSHGSGKEWSLNRYQELIDILPVEQFKIFITGSEKERLVLHSWINSLNRKVVDLTGSMQLDQFIVFLHHADGMIASGTGPLHLAAASGIPTLGLFPIAKSIDARRWGPIGKNAQYLESEACDLDHIKAITVYEKVKIWNK